MLDCLHNCIKRRQLLERGLSSSVVAQMVLENSWQLRSVIYIFKKKVEVGMLALLIFLNKECPFGLNSH